MIIGPLAGVTIVTPDLDAAVAAYGEWLGYRGAAPAPVDRALAERWGTPAAAGARMAMLRPAGGETRFVRLVEGAPDPGHRPLATLGWAAAEIVVADVERLADRLARSPFSIIGPPKTLEFDFTDKIKAMQVTGGGGEVLYLTEIGGEVPGFALPRPQGFVGAPFIMVLGVADIAAAAGCYAAPDRPPSPEFAAPIEVLSAAHGLPADHRHRLATVPLGAMSYIEIDAYPPAAGPRPPSSIGLPSGIAMASFTGAADGMARGDAGEWIESLADD